MFSAPVGLEHKLVCPMHGEAEHTETAVWSRERPIIRLRKETGVSCPRLPTGKLLIVLASLAAENRLSSCGARV